MPNKDDEHALNKALPLPLLCSDSLGYYLVVVTGLICTSTLVRFLQL
ncbi:hypothetical protein [Acinetobacter pittii]|nr:hypothetical protein [Acinetobacter pittii]MCF1283203.1 hypothetical protein [Acinetobacter pittii]